MWVMEKREAGVGDTVKREKGAAGVGGAARTGSAGSSSVTKAALPGTNGKSPSHSNLLPGSGAELSGEWPARSGRPVALGELGPPSRNVGSDSFVLGKGSPVSRVGLSWSKR